MSSVQCVFHQKQRTKAKFKRQECNTGLCDTQYFRVYHTKLHSWRSNNTKTEKRNTQTPVNIFPCDYWTDIFQQHFLDEIIGMKWVWILQKELYEVTETCKKILFVRVFASLQQYEKK